VSRPFSVSSVIAEILDPTRLVEPPNGLGVSCGRRCRSAHFCQPDPRATAKPGAALERCTVHRGAGGRCKGHRFFDQHVFPRPQELDANRLMKRIRCQNDGGIEGVETIGCLFRLDRARAELRSNRAPPFRRNIYQCTRSPPHTKQCRDISPFHDGAAAHNRDAKGWGHMFIESQIIVPFRKLARSGSQVYTVEAPLQP